MNDHWNAPPRDGLALESNDSRPSPDYAVSPFPAYTAPLVPAVPTEGVHHFNRKALARQRRSPIAQLLKGSPWVLKAYQLDMDCPPGPDDYIDEQCTTLLAEHGSDRLRPHTLHIDFSTDAQPGVSPDGVERHECRLSVAELARTSLDPATFLGLMRSMEADRPLHPDTPELTLKKLIRLITQSTWTEDYQGLLNTFWAKHERTYHLLARCSFIDGLCQLRSQRRISADGYRLALDTLGLSTFPDSLASLDAESVARLSVVGLVELNGRTVPGIFQLKSRNTDHCYLHVLGEEPQCIEYISADAPWREPPLLDALNRSPWHRSYLDAVPRIDHATGLGLRDCSGDVFRALTLAQQAFVAECLKPEGLDAADSVLMPIQRSLKHVAALDIWDEHADIRSRIPVALQTANHMMKRWLNDNYALDANPDQVFIRYLPGSSTTPLGHARAPVTEVRAPSLLPVALDQALVDNYRVEHPVGYIDEGGRTAVYIDRTSKGQWSAINEVPIGAETIEQHIRDIDFLGVMTQQLQRFWDRQGTEVERSLRQTFVGQALVSLKRGTLSRAGFDLLTQVLEDSETEPRERSTQWSALGFHLQRSLLPSTHCDGCIGLLVFSHDQNPGRVLYQPGQEEPFIEFQHRDELVAHLARAAADAQWRQTLLRYVPLSQHARLDYILTLWGQVRAAPKPLSDLRPWLNALYHEDVHQAQAREFCEHPLTLSPFVFMCQVMRRNSLDDAQDSVTTSAQVSLREWSKRLNHLQLMLAPLSVLLSPAAVASMVTAAGTLYLDARAANLPGNRDKEKRQLLLSALSLGLLQTGVLTPGLLRAFRTFTTTSKAAAPLASVSQRSFSTLLQRSMRGRRTQLERFFSSGSLLKTWTIPGSGHFATLPVKAWKLEGKFLLWTSERAQARTLVVSTHGYYLPWSKTAAIPNGTELRTYAPHGFELVDPRLHRVVSQNIQPFSLLKAGENMPGPASSQLPAWQLTHKALAGTSQLGKVKNYTLGKFQSERYESYRDISNVVRYSNASPFYGQLMSTPMDVLTVRNRFGTRNPSLETLFGALARQGIHYDHILLLHCRCSAVSSALGRAPAFKAPGGSVPISP
ncbi:DUF6543 domain-containing protein [Xanthomonas sp. WHRI 1810A]|uniref:dermonecrotic toxin domain-containing protein n=1 Tax=Xanthomonas sp. WHRI 1810A TaxID=3161565 RepID=UPI0032E8B797